MRTLARELSKAALMHRLTNFNGKIYFANSMQPIEMREHIPGLWLTGRLSKPGEHDRAQIFTWQQQSVELRTAVPLERLSQPLIAQVSLLDANFANFSDSSAREAA